MADYLKEVLEDFPEFITGRSTILAAGHLFQVRHEDGQKLLYDEWAAALHHTVTQLIFVTLRASKDINMAVAFLYT